MKFPYPLKSQPPVGFPLKDKTLLIYRNESSWTGWDNDEISLYQNVKGEFFLKGRPVRNPRSMHRSENTNPIKEIRVSKRWVCSLFERLEHTSIPAFPSQQMGADGAFFELEIGGFTGKAHYRWWLHGPQGWEILNQIANEIFEKFYHKSLLSRLLKKDK